MKVSEKYKFSKYEWVKLWVLLTFIKKGEDIDDPDTQQEEEEDELNWPLVHAQFTYSNDTWVFSTHTALQTFSFFHRTMLQYKI